jgi:hypothetical protein
LTLFTQPESEQHGFLPVIAFASLDWRFVLLGGAKVARFRVFRAILPEAFADYQSPFVSIDALLTWATTRFGGVTVVLPPCHSGKTVPADTAIIHALGIARVFPHAHAAQFHF